MGEDAAAVAIPLVRLLIGGVGEHHAGVGERSEVVLVEVLLHRAAEIDVGAIDARAQFTTLSDLRPAWKSAIGASGWPLRASTRSRIAGMM